MIFKANQEFEDLTHDFLMLRSDSTVGKHNRNAKHALRTLYLKGFQHS